MKPKRSANDSKILNKKNAKPSVKEINVLNMASKSNAKQRNMLDVNVLNMTSSSLDSSQESKKS